MPSRNEVRTNSYDLHVHSTSVRTCGRFSSDRPVVRFVHKRSQTGPSEVLELVCGAEGLVLLVNFAGYVSNTTTVDRGPSGFRAWYADVEIA